MNEWTGFLPVGPARLNQSVEIMVVSECGNMAAFVVAVWTHASRRWSRFVGKKSQAFLWRGQALLLSISARYFCSFFSFCSTVTFTILPVKALSFGL